MQHERLLKVLVIGDLGVGKTSIIKRYVHQVFSQHYRATIGVDFALKVLNWDHKTVVRLQLWDIAVAFLLLSSTDSPHPTSTSYLRTVSVWCSTVGSACQAEALV
ncbi:ras-related protein Rab-38-like protein [Lates japonicus]|uniref:Ras-related protein Rab-38-like protein n=1 Tax=Lates japonicus TaxID=270547 RepID=A0AAD3NN55_LATJO|nr:ras-related protein Rab-38-like protein [Lates japonicus]